MKEKMPSFLERLKNEMPAEVFKREIIGEWHEPEEVTDDRNVTPGRMFYSFTRICQKIEQPHATCRADAIPGEWYLSLCHDKNWYLMVMTEEGGKRLFTIPGLRSNDMFETLLYVDAFISQYSKNREEKS